ncbi:DMT family transporter [Prevotella sp. OH937_COT-195]|uniref:DMT family transporter n=1 Tax=Prevotella sp. OH937_COT-195 TaxID=2491051 RepID=UPI000F655024|nr:DMT family transporter [Prevotella sp. OH937_COT-195]RRD02206.1 DMT family transporter [Prevotella sp. OH937_COT-195]
MNNSFKGYVLGILAAASYGTNPLFALPLLNAGIDASSVLFIRYLLAIPMLATIMVARGRGFGLKRNQWIPLATLGLLMAASSLLLYVSYAYIGAAIASTLLFVYPIMVTIIMALFFHEKVSVLTVFSIVLAMTGIGLLYRGGDGRALSLAGLVMVAGSALSYAIYLVWVNMPRLKDVPTLKLTLYVIFFGTFLYAYNFDTDSFNILSNSPWLWADALAMAFFPTAFSLLCTSAAIQKIGSTPVAILGAFEPVSAVLFAVTIFNEPMTLRLGMGILLIISSVTLIISAGSVVNFLMRVRKMFPRIKR